MQREKSYHINWQGQNHWIISTHRPTHPAILSPTTPKHLTPVHTWPAFCTYEPNLFSRLVDGKISIQFDFLPCMQLYLRKVSEKHGIWEAWKPSLRQQLSWQKQEELIIVYPTDANRNVVPPSVPVFSILICSKPHEKYNHGHNMSNPRLRLITIVLIYVISIYTILGFSHRILDSDNIVVISNSKLVIQKYKKRSCYLSITRIMLCYIHID